MSGVVDGLQSHAACEGSITNNGNAFERLTPVVSRHGHTQRRGDGRAGVASSEVIEVALRALEVTRDPVLLAQGIEVVEPAGDQFVGVGLMAHIPDHTVMVEVERLVQRQGQLYNAKTRTQVTATGGHHLQMPLANLPSHILELSRAESVQFIRMLQISEMHALPTPIRSIYGNRPGSCLDRILGRMMG